MKNYVHLSLYEREVLFGYRKEGLSFRTIATKMDRSHSSLVREWRKNTKYHKKYLPCVAHTKAEKRGVVQRTKAPLKSHQVYLYVRSKLRCGWSPETIAGRLSIDYPGLSIDDDTIYRYVYNPKKTRGEDLRKYLTLHRKRRLKHQGRKVKGHRWNNVLSINQRPQEINGRSRIGDFETDNMEGIKSDKESISVSVERSSRFVLYDVLADHKPSTKTKALVSSLRKLPTDIVLSITCDRGIENKNYQDTSASLGHIPIYFCNPYHSWEKGGVENANKRLRRFIPKHHSLKHITQDYLTKLQDYANHTPRKCLAYKTPYEVLQSHITSCGALQVRM